MRSCPTCGMAVIGDIETCPRCQTAVPRPVAAAPAQPPAVPPPPVGVASSGTGTGGPRTLPSDVAWPPPPLTTPPPAGPAPPPGAPGPAWTPTPASPPHAAPVLGPTGAAPGFGPPGLAPPPLPDPGGDFFGGTLAPQPYDPRTVPASQRTEGRKGLSGGAVLGILAGVVLLVVAVLVVPKLIVRTGAETGLEIGDSGYLLDKPAGWASGSFNDMAANLGYMSEGGIPGTDLEGIRAFSRGDAALAVAVIAVPPEMAAGLVQGIESSAAVPGLAPVGQPYEHSLGSAVEFDATQMGEAGRLTMIAGDGVLVIAVVVAESGEVTDTDLADYAAVVESLRAAGA